MPSLLHFVAAIDDGILHILPDGEARNDECSLLRGQSRRFAGEH